MSGSPEARWRTWRSALRVASMTRLNGRLDDRQVDGLGMQSRLYSIVCLIEGRSRGRVIMSMGMSAIAGGA